jgi:hypothetical protein
MPWQGKTTLNTPAADRKPASRELKPKVDPASVKQHMMY